MGSGSAALAASFIGLRHTILQGDFRTDTEVVSGIALGTLAACVRTLVAGRQAGATAGGVWFVGGCALHHAHRYWLNYRLTHEL